MSEARLRVSPLRGSQSFCATTMPRSTSGAYSRVLKCYDARMASALPSDKDATTNDDNDDDDTEDEKHDDDDDSRRPTNDEDRRRPTSDDRRHQRRSSRPAEPPPGEAATFAKLDQVTGLDDHEGDNDVAVRSCAPSGAQWRTRRSVLSKTVNCSLSPEQTS